MASVMVVVVPPVGGSPWCGHRCRSRSDQGLIKFVDELKRPIGGEAVVVDVDGSFLIATEEPAVRRYEADGNLLGLLPLPDVFRVAPVRRARHNETFEGITMLPGNQGAGDQPRTESAVRGAIEGGARRASKPMARPLRFTAETAVKSTQR